MHMPIPRFSHYVSSLFMSDERLHLTQLLLAVNPQLNEESCAYMLSVFQRREMQAKETFIAFGEEEKKVGVVLSGLMRGYYINDKGEEITVRFVREGSYATHYSALITQQPSRYRFYCLEPTILYELTFEDMLRGFDLHPEIERYGRKVAEGVLVEQQTRIESFQFLHAEARYKAFIATNPSLFNRISLSHLATYLGIARPSLSRIRKKLAKES